MLDPTLACVAALGQNSAPETTSIQDGRAPKRFLLGAYLCRMVFNMSLNVPICTSDCDELRAVPHGAAAGTEATGAAARVRQSEERCRTTQSGTSYQRVRSRPIAVAHGTAAAVSNERQVAQPGDRLIVLSHHFGDGSRVRSVREGCRPHPTKNCT